MEQNIHTERRGMSDMKRRGITLVALILCITMILAMVPTATGNVSPLIISHAKAAQANGLCRFPFFLFLREHILANRTQRADKIFRDIFPLGTGGNAAFGIAQSLIIFPTANVAYMFHIIFLLNFV
jgi:hypothetical protein